MEFELLRHLIEELNQNNSTLDKVKVLSKPMYDNEFIKGVLEATHNPFKQYYVTPDNLKKRSDLVSMFCEYESIFDLLNALSSRTITGHAAIAEVNSFIKSNKEYADIIYNILDRNLKTRVSEKLINKVFPNLIPSFDVALANKYDAKMEERVDFVKDIWYASRKLDGLRCIVVVDYNGVVKAYSRSGIEFLTLSVIIDAVQRLNLTGVVFDGEACIVDSDGNENFQAILKEYNRKNHTIKNPKYKIFDMISFEEFTQLQGKVTFSDRIELLRKTVTPNNTLDIVPQWKVESKSHLVELTAMADNNGWEGIMIRKDIPYEGKRSNNMLKCKNFHDAEYTVVDVEYGPFRVIVNGQEVIENVLSNVVIIHKGCRVSVGSGFSIEQRRQFKADPNLILNKTITVKYFEETTNQNGEYSLRFPVVKAIYDGKREV